MILCIVHSTVACGRLEPVEIAQSFVSWLAIGPKDAGKTLPLVLNLVAQTITWEEAERSNLSRSNVEGVVPGMVHANV